jgi:putative transposase
VGHSFSNNHVHVVYSTKNRVDLIPSQFENRLYSFIAEIAREHGIPLLAAGGIPNHSHLLFLLPSAIALANAINTFKTNSSRFLRNQGIDFNWQEGYGAFAVCASHIEKVKAYIRNQREHHKKRDWE